MGSHERLSELHAALAGRIDDLITPLLIVDLDAVDHNIAAVVDNVGQPRRWRPHIKTVKQGRLIESLLRAGVGRFKCATLDELALILDTAERVRPDGDVDAMLAYPVGKTVLRGVLQLLAVHDGAHVHVVADSPDHFVSLERWLGELGAPARLGVMLEVDTGMHRTGSRADVWVEAMARWPASCHATVTGVHGYEGHVAWTERETAFAGYEELLTLARALPTSSVAHVVTSGSHSFAHALAHEGLGAGPWSHQVSPGTLLLSDLRSHAPAEALQLRQAAFVASRVVSLPGPGRVTLDAGSKAISPDRPAPGCRVLGWTNLEALPPSEEHLPLRVKSGGAPAHGSVVFLVPDHVCTTVNLYRSVVYVRGSAWAGTAKVEASRRTLRLSDRRP